MTIRTTLIASSLFAAALASGTAQAALPSYTFTDLGTLDGYSTARAINNAGQVVGYGYNDAILWSGATMTSLGYGMATDINNAGQAVGFNQWGVPAEVIVINDAGQMAGNYNFSGSAYHAALWVAGDASSSPTDLGTLGGTNSFATSINSSGQVAGTSQTTGDVSQHATLWNGTAMTDLGAAGGLYSVANAINDAGIVVGYSLSTNGNERAIMWSGTTSTILGTLGGTESGAFAINNLGQVVGHASTAGNTAAHATLWTGTTAIDLNSFLDPVSVSSGWELIRAFGINDNGSIVGEANNTITGETHGFLLSTVAAIPEPETYAMMLAGLGLVGFMARRGKHIEA